MNSEGPRRRSVIAAAIGNALGWYDFAIYIYSTTIIARKFFPAEDERLVLLGGILTLGASFLGRPIGAFVFGRLADRIGRKPVLQMTVLLMAAATFTVGFLPTHAAIGVVAPLLLIVARFLQGIAVGGEWGNGVALMAEWAPAGRRGLFAALHQATLVLGLAMATVALAVLERLLSPVDLVDWGWRFPFIVGGLLTGMAGLWIREAVEESPAFARAARTATAATAESPAGNFGRAARVFGITIVWTASYNALLNRIPVWTQDYLDLNRNGVLWLNSATLLTALCLLLLAAHLSDRIGRRPILLAASIALVLLPYPLFSYLDKNEVPPAIMLGALVLFVLPVATISGAAPAAFAEMFTTRSRAAWMSTAYALAAVIFGATLPYVAARMLDHFQLASVHALYLVVAATVSTAVIWTLRETAFDDLK